MIIGIFSNLPYGNIHSKIILILFALCTMSNQLIERHFHIYFGKRYSSLIIYRPTSHFFHQNLSKNIFPLHFQKINQSQEYFHQSVPINKDATIFLEQLQMDRIIPTKYNNLQIITGKIMIQGNENYQLNDIKNRKKVEREFIECQSESLYQVQSQRTSKSNKINPLKNKKKKSKKSNQGIWSKQENKKYEKFLSKHLKIFSENIVIRRKKKIHVLMSKAIKTRTPQQCRSHHQKMLRSHIDLFGIIEFLKKQYECNDKADNLKIKAELDLQSIMPLEQIKNEFPDDFELKYSPFHSYYSPDSPQLEKINTILWWDGQLI